MELDSDEASLLNSPRFVKKVIDNMGGKFQKLYEEELDKKREWRRMRKEKKREQENRRFEEEKLARERDLKRMKEERDVEMTLLGTILKFLWLTCLFVNIAVFLIRDFAPYFFVKTISSESAFFFHTSITLPFVALSVIVMLLFTDG